MNMAPRYKNNNNNNKPNCTRAKTTVVLFGERKAVQKPTPNQIGNKLAPTTTTLYCSVPPQSEWWLVTKTENPDHVFDGIFPFGLEKVSAGSGVVWL